MVTPALAMVAATTAFSSGVTATSFWPILDIPSAAASGIGPVVDSATCSGVGSGTLSRPYDRAVLRRASAPVSRPNWTNAVLHECANASRNDTVSALAQGAPP